MNWLTDDDERLDRGFLAGLRVPLPAPTGPVPRPSRRELLFDFALALVVGFPVKGAQYGMAMQPFTVSAQTYRKDDLFLVVLCTITPLTLRRRFPLAAFWAVLALLAVPQVPLSAPLGLAVLITGYSAAVYSPYRRYTWYSLVLAVFEVFIVGFPQWIPVQNNLGLVPVAIPLLVGAIAYGSGVRGRATESIVDQQRVREVAYQETIRRAVEHERSRIARELHDVVTHNVSVMVVMAGAARKVLATDPAQATEALLAVEASGRAAMSELRQVMGLLTEDERDQGQLAPQPGLDQIAALVARIREAGIPVGYTVSGTPRPLPPGRDLTAYRVVQEALTNTVKHAVGASADVRIEYRPEELYLEISDSGGTPGQSAASGNGKGLIGLRERVAVHGGTVQAGRTPDGGFRIGAAIPFGAQDAAE